MPEDLFRPRWGDLFRLTVALVVLLSLAGCNKKSGEAIVLEKEHIAIREPTPTPTATAEPSASPTGPTESGTDPIESTGESIPGPEESTSGEEMVTKIGENEVSVDGYVMKKEVRGTGKDPRAMEHERWIVRVQMIADLRRIDVQAQQPQWEKLKIGDRVHVTYRQGKYTGTVWNSEID